MDITAQLKVNETSDAAISQEPNKYQKQAIEIKHCCNVKYKAAFTNSKPSFGSNAGK